MTATPPSQAEAAPALREAPPPRRRRARVVVGEIQWRIFWVIVGGMGLGLLVSFALVLRLLRTLKQTLAFVPAAGVAILLDDAVEAVAFVVMIEVMMLALAGFYALSMSHRIAGPVYRIERDLERMDKEGKVYPIRIRPGDTLGVLVERLNRVLLRFGSGR